MSSAPPVEGRRFRGLSSEERRAQRRAQLIDAGLEVFGDKGFHASGVRDLCAQARLTERYFYESFENRESLFWAVYEDAVARVREAVQTAVLAVEDPSDVSALARTGLKAYLELIHAEPRLARILLVDVFSIGADAGRRSLLATRGFSELVGNLVTGMEAKLPDRYNGPLVADGLVGSTLHIVLLWAADDFTTPIDQVLDHCVLFYEAIARETLSEPPRDRKRQTRPQTHSRPGRKRRRSR